MNCGDETEYNRRVENLETGRVVGRLCASCEQARFGDGLQSVTVSGCIYCDGRPVYALPEHVVSLDDSASGECEVAGFFVTDDTPRLCRSHLDVMRPETGTFWPEPSTIAEAGD